MRISDWSSDVCSSDLDCAVATTIRRPVTGASTKVCGSETVKLICASADPDDTSPTKAIKIATKRFPQRSIIAVPPLISFQWLRLTGRRFPPFRRTECPARRYRAADRWSTPETFAPVTLRSEAHTQEIQSLTR